MATSAATSLPGDGGAAAPAMDAAFIERHQIVERYLAGKLPPRGAVDFERWCRDNPQLVESLGIAERVNAALRLIEVSGKPGPWAEKPRRFYEKPLPFFIAAALAAVFGVATALLSARTSEAERQLTVLEKRVAERPLQPVTSTRTLTLVPSRTGPSRRPVATLDGRSGEMADMKVDVSWSRYANFRVLIDRVDQGRVAVLGHQVRDSNGQLRLALNGSALGPGDYQLTMEGLNWRGEPEPQAWVTFSIAP